MISDQDVFDIDSLESMLLERAVSYDKLRRHYAMFLLDLLDKKNHPDTNKKHLENLALYLKDAAATARINRGLMRWLKLSANCGSLKHSTGR